MHLRSLERFDYDSVLLPYSWLLLRQPGYGEDVARLLEVCAERQVAVPKSGRDVVIEEGVWISSNATVVGPCRIGAHAVVGVGSLVLKDVEPYTVVAGNPARVLRTIPRPGTEEAERTDPDAGPAGAVTAGS